MGPPVLSLWGWTEGEPRGRLLCSGVLGKGQCTQLRSGGGLLFWLFHTTSSLAKLGTLEISVMTRKRLSMRS
ncbi:hypothetical protein EYF80_003127 [Liparis tanakae]|uniref:Uncharacterized protein n=1 Tax=Liparis tanakae TaxID=230148 RepID=A0A4Z2J8Z8_9TELE|nr:hypothetical protein EYF80_003127 [Liparis tanakae]